MLKFLEVPILDKEENKFGERIRLENSEDFNIKNIIMFLENFKQKKNTFISLDKELLKNKTVLSLLAPDNIILVAKEPVKNFKTAAYLDYPEEIIQSSDFIFIKNLEELEKALTYNKKIIIENVKTYDDFSKLKELPEINYFEGFFFKEVKNFESNGIISSKIDLINLFNFSIDEFQIEKIEEEIKRTPDLSIKLLKYVNSAAFSFRDKVSSIRKALMILGQKQFVNWLLLQIYLADENVKDYIVEIAAIRGKTLEILAEKLNQDKEKAFIIGVLSLADVILKMPLENILNELNLSDDIKKALLNRETPLGKILSLIEHLENEDLISVETLSKDVGISAQNVMDAQLKAIVWYNQINLG